MDIGEVSRRSGVPVSTLRFYEEKGLIASAGRRGLRRQFDPGVLERLALIALGRSGGFALEEIALMFAPDGQPNIDRKMLTAKADDLDRIIHRLRAMRDGLRHAAACPAPRHMECPTFRRILRAVTAGVVRAQLDDTRQRGARSPGSQSRRDPPRPIHEGHGQRRRRSGVR